MMPKPWAEVPLAEDISRMAARVLMEDVGGVFRPEERADAYGLFVDRFRAALECQAVRLRESMLTPSDN